MAVRAIPDPQKRTQAQGRVLRLAVGVVLPPAAGALWIWCWFGQALTGLASLVVLGYCLLPAYLLMGVQSLLYAVTMELARPWLRRSVLRFVAVSALLGLAAGATVSPFIGGGLAAFGLLVGLVTAVPLLLIGRHAEARPALRAGPH